MAKDKPEITEDGELPFAESDQFPDAAQKTAAFYAKCSLHSLRRILDHVRRMPEFEQDANTIWDDAHWYFPDFFPLSKTGEITDPPSRLQLLKRMAELNLPVVIPEGDYNVPTAADAAQSLVLRCQFCMKVVSSTSGRTLHEKTCKKRPPEVV